MDIEVYGLIASLCTGSSFVPQVIKVVRNKSAKDISLLMFIIFTLGLVFWLLYSIFIKSYVMLALDIVEIPMCLVIIYFKIKFG